MKSEELYDNLKQLAERLDITVYEENLKPSGIRIKSGFCRVRGNNRFIVDKRLKIPKKIDVLAEFLSTMPHEEIYVVPTVRDLLNRYSKHKNPIQNDHHGSEGGAVPFDPEVDMDDN